MLRQEINLYQPLESSSKITAFLTWKRLWQAYSLFFILFFLIYLSSLWQLHAVKKTREKKYQEVSVLQNKFYKFRATFPQLLFTNTASQTLVQLQHELESQQKLLSIIMNRNYFSQNLLIFSQIIVPNVWLTEILIQKNGADITLKGQSTDPGQLQKFFDNITHEKTFEQYILNIKDIENVAKTGPAAANAASASNNLTFEINLVKKT